MDPNKIANEYAYGEARKYVPNPDVACANFLELVYFIFLIITLIFIIIEVLKSKNKKETLKNIIIYQGSIITISLLLIAFRNSNVLNLEGFLYSLPSIIALIISIILFVIEIKKLKGK